MKQRAQAKLSAMKARASGLRRRLLIGAAVLFAVLWLAIFTQMISGHDPALGPATASVRPAPEEAVATESAALPEGEDEDDAEHGEDRDDWFAPVREALAPVEEVVSGVEGVVVGVEGVVEGPGAGSDAGAEELEPASSGQS